MSWYIGITICRPVLPFLIWNVYIFLVLEEKCRILERLQSVTSDKCWFDKKEKSSMRYFIITSVKENAIKYGFVLVQMNVFLVLWCFLKNNVIQVNFVISKFTGPLQNFELSEIGLKGSKGLRLIVNSVR